MKKITGPLSNIRVLDFTRLLPGPLCTHILRRLGAEVVKVDSNDGDYTRHIPPLIKNEHGSLFESLNAGKRGLGLDLKHPKAKEVIRKIVSSFDVIVEGGRPGAMAKLGIGYNDLLIHNPKLVYCSISGIILVKEVLFIILFRWF